MNSRLLAFGLRAKAPRNNFSRAFCRSARLFDGKGFPLKTETSQAKKYVKPQVYKYPEYLLIWNAGAAKSALVGIIKLAPVLLFAGACVFLAPRYVFIAEEAGWKAVPAVLFGAVPMIFVAIATSSYVAAVRIQLPKTARISQDALMRFCAKPPPSTVIEFTTVRLIGFHKTSVLTLGDLRAVKGRGIANMERALKEDVKARRSWWAKVSYWMKEPRNRFYVGGDEGVRRAAFPKARVWPAIWQSIQNNTRSKI